jgi:hypothetical protein
MSNIDNRDNRDNKDNKVSIKWELVITVAISLSTLTAFAVAVGGEWKDISNTKRLLIDQVVKLNSASERIIVAETQIDQIIENQRSFNKDMSKFRSDMKNDISNMRSDMQEFFLQSREDTRRYRYPEDYPGNPMTPPQ